MTEDEMLYLADTEEEGREVPHKKERLLIVLDSKVIWFSDGEKWNLYTVVTKEMKPYLEEAIASVKMEGVCD